MEWYTSTHSEKVDDLLGWPWRRFDRFYESAKKRALIETLEDRKNQIIAALWSNPNLDDDKGTRTEAIEDIEEKYETAVDFILSDGKEEEHETDDEYGFFDAGRRGQKKIMQPSNYEGTVREVITYDGYEIDQ